ncbi:MAG TPA: hypothetical protein VK870_06430 [Ignavibacteriaceae bacterium]|nr:hypothetical protein [Ignavibacteriaceae bacterium]
MKNYYFILAVILLIAGIFFTGCDNTRDDVKEANQDMIDAQNQFEQEWREFKRDAEVRIDKNEQRIADFKESMKSTTARFKAKYENEVLSLEQNNIELRKKLNEYKYDGKNNWDVFKREFNREVDKVVDSLDDIFSRNE